jgi:putative nucleotidyltransferase with HDIG domain
MKIIDFVKENLDPLNYNHTLRVRKLAIKIAKKEGADKKVVDVASLLHEVGKLKSEDWFKHHEKSFEEAVKITKRNFQDAFDSLQTESGRKIANKYYKLGMKFLGMVSD